MAYCILSCDGGGIRGLLPSLLIQQLSSDIPAFLGNVGLYAGTSAGGLVSLGLASSVPVANIVSLFENNGSQIFTPFSSGASAINTAKFRAALEARVAAASGDSWFDWVIAHIEEIVTEIVYVKYNNTGLQALLTKLLPGTPLNKLSNRVMVTTFQLNDPATGNWAPITISNFPNDPAGVTYPVDAALSTSAAPTYFPPYQHPTFGYCVDGGVYANNPGCMAIAAALNSGVALSDIVMLSVGTGANPENVQVSPPPTNYGSLMWMLPIALNSTPASPIVSILTDGVASADAFICQQLLGSNFRRLQVPLSSAVPLDDYQAVPLLKSAATAYMNAPAWSETRCWVEKTFV
jgi:patatin-like phospholipase/acyl hydrolase